MAPKISIIVPAFNEEKHISRCLDSILNQTFTDFEVICIDDGSTDSTYSIIEEYSKKDSRIIPLKNTGKGVSSARNYGIEKSCGEYIGFVDSDDFIQPQMYEFLYNSIIKSGLKIALCNYKKVSFYEKKFFNFIFKIKNFDNILDFSNNDYFLENELIISSVWNKLIKRDLINFKFQNYKIGEDTVFCSELWNNVKKVTYIDLPLYGYYINANSTSSLLTDDPKWLDLILTRFISAKNYKKNSKIIYSYFLNHGMKILLSYRFFSNNTDKKVIKMIYKKNKKEYYSCENISLKNKIYVLISFYFPFIYSIIRKLSDKTVR